MGCGSSTDASHGMGSPPAKRQDRFTGPRRRACNDVVVSGLRFPEGPRWHDGRLWFSDQHDGWVCVVNADSGEMDKVLEVKSVPSGLGWLPDGRMLIVSMEDRRLLRFDRATGEVATHADLSGIAAYDINDMVVDARGRAYVGDCGWDFRAKGAQKKDGPLISVGPTGDGAHVATAGVDFPNGVVILPGGRTLVVAETFGAKLTAFDVDPDTGALSGKRLWAAMPPGRFADGICCDAEGAIWVASLAKETLRVKEGGEITDVVTHERMAVACALGGEDGKTLFVCTSESSDPKETVKRTGRMERIRVDVPHAGWP